MRLVRVALSLLALTVTATAQEAEGPRTGVLCVYTILAGAKLDSEVCGWVGTPVGQAVSQGVADLEAYILANSSRPVAEYRSNYAAGLSTMLALSEDKRAAYCAGEDPDYPNYFGAMRFKEPQEVSDKLKGLLSRPGEPTYGDCF